MVSAYRSTFVAIEMYSSIGFMICLVLELPNGKYFFVKDFQQFKNFITTDGHDEYVAPTNMMILLNPNIMENIVQLQILKQGIVTHFQTISRTL